MASKDNVVTGHPKLVLITDTTPYDGNIMPVAKPVTSPVEDTASPVDVRSIEFQTHLQNYLQEILQIAPFQRPLPSKRLLPLHPMSIIGPCSVLYDKINIHINDLENYVTHIDPTLPNHDDMVEKGLHLLQLLYITRRLLSTELNYLDTL